jgi:hypothetical protein
LVHFIAAGIDSEKAKKYTKASLALNLSESDILNLKFMKYLELENPDELKFYKYLISRQPPAPSPIKPKLEALKDSVVRLTTTVTNLVVPKPAHSMKMHCTTTKFP